VEQKDDPRLRRLAGARGSGASGEAAERRQIRAAQVVDEEESQDEEEEEQKQRDALLRRAQVSIRSFPPQKREIKVSRACGAERSLRIAQADEESEEEDEDMLELRRMRMRRRYSDSSHAPRNPALLCGARRHRAGRSSPLPRECGLLGDY